MVIGKFKALIHALQQNKLEWFNRWVDGTLYNINNVVRDGDWTMVANRTTIDRPGPIAIGGPHTEPPTATAWTTASYTGVVKMVHKYTMLEGGWLNQIRIRTAAWDLDVVSKITIINNTTGENKVFSDPILTNDGWAVLTVSQTIVLIGSTFDITYEYYNSTAASNIDGNWKADEGNTGIPASQEFTVDDSGNPTVIEISHTDIDGGNRATELDGIIVDSIITAAEIANPDRSFKAKVTAVDTTSTNSTKYNCVLISLGTGNNLRNNRDCTINIDVPITVPSVYNLNADYWLVNPSWATITSELYYDGVIQADVNDAYGIELIFQHASISPDWDLLSLYGG